MTKRNIGIIIAGDYFWTVIKLIKLAPSILSADFSRLKEHILETRDAGCEYLHIDVMDGQFVPNLTFGAPVYKWIRPHTDQFFDVHLMIVDPLRYIDDFAKAGADNITIHHEACTNQIQTLEYIRSKGVKASVSIKPKTDPYVVKEYLPYVDMILIMSVEPGFGGQSFIPSALHSTRVVRELVNASGRDIDVEIDGGIGAGNIADVVRAGANVIVAGSSIFGAPDMKKAVIEMREAAENA